MTVAKMAFARQFRHSQAATPERRTLISEARKMWGSGYSARQIGLALGVSKNVIIGLAHRNQFPSRPSPISENPISSDERDRIMILAKEFTDTAVAAIVGRSRTTVARIARGP